MDLITKKEDLSASEAFDFSAMERNLALGEMGFKAPTLTSTGTTIVSALYDVLNFNFYMFKIFNI